MARDKEKLYTSHEAGALLQMDPSSVVKWVNDGKLPAYRTPGGHRRIRASDLMAFLKKHGMYVPPELEAGRKKVLLVDDDKATLTAMKRAWKNHADLELEVAEGGIEGLLKVGSWKPDVLVLDVRMPDLDGLQVLQRLHSNPETQALEVVMLAGKPSADLEKKAKALGARALCAKPISPAELASAVVGKPS